MLYFIYYCNYYLFIVKAHCVIFFLLQGTFSVYEKLQKVREFVSENLDNPNREFDLLLPGGIKLTDENLNLLELKLVPAAVLNFHLSSDNNLPRNGFLNSECMSLLSDL